MTQRTSAVERMMLVICLAGIVIVAVCFGTGAAAKKDDKAGESRPIVIVVPASPHEHYHESTPNGRFYRLGASNAA